MAYLIRIEPNAECRIPNAVSFTRPSRRRFAWPGGGGCIARRSEVPPPSTAAGRPGGVAVNPPSIPFDERGEAVAPRELGSSFSRSSFSLSSAGTVMGALRPVRVGQPEGGAGPAQSAGLPAAAQGKRRPSRWSLDRRRSGGRDPGVDRGPLHLVSVGSLSQPTLPRDFQGLGG